MEEDVGLQPSSSSNSPRPSHCGSHQSPHVSPNLGVRPHPRSILLSMDSIPSCHVTPLLTRAVSRLNETDSHLVRLTESIKMALMDSPEIRHRYFPTNTSSANDSPLPQTPGEPDPADPSANDGLSIERKLSVESSAVKGFLQSDDSLAYEQRDASSVNDTEDGDTLKPLSSDNTTKFEYNPEKANMWVELTKIDMSPTLPQRKSRTFCESAQEVLQKLDPVTLQRYGSVSRHTFVSRHASVNKHARNSLQFCDPPKIRETKDPDLPSLKFKFQYLIVTERLKVTVVEATNLLEGGKVEGEAYTYSEASLMPGKLQRQQSKVVKVAKTSIYDCVVYFTGLSLFEMHQMCLRVKVMRKESRLKTPKVIGEVTVSLVDFDLVSETVLDENFNTRIGSRSGSKYGPRQVTVK